MFFCFCFNLEYSKEAAYLWRYVSNCLSCLLYIYVHIYRGQLLSALVLEGIPTPHLFFFFCFFRRVVNTETISSRAAAVVPKSVESSGPEGRRLTLPWYFCPQWNPDPHGGPQGDCPGWQVSLRHCLIRFRSYQVCTTCFYSRDIYPSPLSDGTDN